MRFSQTRCCFGNRRSSAILLALVLGVLNGPAFGSCDSDSPEGVLGCYAQAYSELDVSSLESLLAHDYTWIGVARPHAWTMSRDAKLENARRLFADPDLESAVLTFGSAYHVVEGSEPDTWRIENILVEFVHTSLGVDMVMVEGRTVPSYATIYVRRIGEPNRGYVIYREVVFYPGVDDRR